MPQSRSFKSVHVFQYVILFFCLGILLFSGEFAAQTGTAFRGKSVKSLTIFQPGDAVRIQIWELYQEAQSNLNLTGDYPIDPEGYIIMPLLGEIKVRGLTVYELAQSLQEKLKSYLRNPYVLVRPLIRLTMQGAFNRPGSYLVDPASSYWTLVAQAGGPSSNCDLKGMSVERGGQIVIKKLLGSFEKGISLEEIGIESGDQIIAPARSTVDLGMVISIINLLASVVLLYLRLRTGEW
jgi:polysaccharide export outer membrane protein